MEKITAWEVFFMLLAVIPVSKMLSSIFMRLVARVGTVDEDRWAMIGLGAIGAWRILHQNILELNRNVYTGKARHTLFSSLKHT